jgi:predicted helicase
MKKQAKIYYFSLTDEMTRENKLRWFSSTKIQHIDFEQINPDKNYNWINLADTDFETLLPLANKETKLAKSQKNERAIFKLFSFDDYYSDFKKGALASLADKVGFFNGQSMAISGSFQRILPSSSG